ncbi:YdcF family protein [Brasilonema octagenarum UFV-E1]|uniref:YdcF family protein n=2 Tax=Brasilonema TaxID=383614 RepID=A0A856MNJ6_9CYAN|nr:MULTISPECIES: YdcF family protein [Brasilonema]NMF67448.1 YdcF family protein [Brasilonema octagenarum UFV-OR1]QDL10506.1 YdcF family protein [Brasilonema sennae CENA114]QDL16852.1 YdcF family protein [Brasilonema octagenarum UFV-E1]
MPAKVPYKNQKFPKIRLLKRRQTWTLTLQGWVSVFATGALFLIFTITHIHSFLAVTSPIKADALVVEGWITDEALLQAFSEFSNNSYRQIFTTGIPVERGFYLAEYKNYAEIAAATLKKLGVPKEKLVVVPTPHVIKDRTHASAVAFRQKLLNSNDQLESVNLFTNDAHARRSWLIYKQVLAPIKVGVIAANPSDYDPKKWWVSSEGVRTVISEIIAFIYALFVNWKV